MPTVTRVRPWSPPWRRRRWLPPSGPGNRTLAVVNGTGFETGDASECTSTSGTVSFSSATTRGAWSAYSLRSNPATTAVGWVRIGQPSVSSGVASTFSSLITYHRFYFYYAVKPASGDEVLLLLGKTTPASSDLEVRLNSAGKLAVYDGTPTLQATGSTALSSGTWYRLELKADQSDGVNAVWELKVATGDGASAVEVSGSYALVAGGWNTLYLGKSIDRNGQSVDYFYDDVLIASDQYPGAGRCTMLLPNANGTYQTASIGAGAGSHYQVVDEIPPDSDTTYLLTDGTSGHAETEVLADATGTVSGVINGVKAMARVKFDAAATSVSLRWRVDGVDFDLSAYTTTASYATIARASGTSLTTGRYWTAAMLDTVEVGLLENSSGQTRLTWCGMSVDYTPSTNSYSLSATPGSFALTGVAASLKVGRVVTASPASFVLTGTAAALKWGHYLSAGLGTFVLTGPSAGLRHNYVVTAGVGPFTLTGGSAGLTEAHELTAAAGSFVVTGGVTPLLHKYPLTAAPGSFAVTGLTAGLRRSLLLTAGAGSFVLTGGSASLLHANVLTASPGLFTLTGGAAALAAAHEVAAGAGSFVLTGGTATLTQGRGVTAGVGTFSVTGQPAGLTVTHTVAAAAGVFTLTGKAASLTYSGAGDKTIVAGPGSFLVAGSAAALTQAHKLSAVPGAFALTGRDAGTYVGRVLTANPGPFAVTGMDTDLSYGRVFVCSLGAFTVAGRDSTLTYSGAVIPVPPVVTDRVDFVFMRTDSMDFLYTQTDTTDFPFVQTDNVNVP